MRVTLRHGGHALVAALLLLSVAAAALLSESAAALAQQHRLEQQDRRDWPERLTIGSASPGGTYDVYGAGWARLVRENLGIAAELVVTAGPVQNVALLQSGELDLAMVTMGPAWEAWTGENPLAPGERHDRLRALFPMYRTPFQVIALAESGLGSIAELEGRTVGVGPAGGTADAYFPRFLEILGIRVLRRNGGAGELSRLLRDGRLDAFAFAAGIPVAAFAEVEAARPATVFAFTEAQIERLLAEVPTLGRFTIPAGTYRGAADSLETVAMWNFAVARADLPDSLTHAIVRTVLENRGRMLAVHPCAAETRPENALHNTVLPFHPGAARYFREIGIELPQRLVQPDAAG